jgi:hypothetical protein
MANVSEPIALTVAEDGVVKTGALSPKRRYILSQI